jgi:hypothetical protein
MYRIVTGKWDISLIYEGEDGRPSTSKLQWFLWTVVIIFAYVAVYAARGMLEPITEIPRNVLLAMGFSVTTMAVSKGITTSFIANGRLFKTNAPSGGSPRGIFLDDHGFPDLSKIQMMAWTFIAIGVYLVNLSRILNAHPIEKLPDIDSALMVLMGLGQGAYLGKKLTTDDQARLSGLSIASGAPGTMVKISGLSLGEQQNGSFITSDGTPFPVVIRPTDWTDSLVTFEIPKCQPSGAPWPDGGQKIMLGLIVGGKASTNQLPFNVIPTPKPDH